MRVFLLLAAIHIYITVAVPGKFLSNEPEENLVSAKEITNELENAFEALLGMGAMSQYSERMAFVEQAIWQTFQALPKNKQGRLAPRSVRHLMHRYFSKVHGWTIEGLKGSIDGMDGLKPEAGKLGGRVGILADTVPAVIEAALEARQAGRGLSMTEVVAFAVAIERLVMEEAVKILVNSFEVNGVSMKRTVSRAEFEDVMIAFASHFSIDGPLNVTDAKLKNDWNAHMIRDPVLMENSILAEDLVNNFVFATRDTVNPFQPAPFSFEWTSKVLSVASNAWGRSLDTQCHELREVLENFDTEGTGRVPLHVFKEKRQVSTFMLRETEQTLRDIGALDESVPGKPMVRISNYIMSPSNCGEYSGYYSVCCRDHCADILEQLEGKVQSPTVEAERLFYAVGNLSSTGDDLEGPESPLFGPGGQSLRDRLAVIAEHNGGQVPLHGRMFSQWLHYAFPRQCPHPVKALSRVVTRVYIEANESFPGIPLIPDATDATDATSTKAPELIQALKTDAKDLVMSVAPKQWELVPEWTQEESNPLLDEIIATPLVDQPSSQTMKNVMRILALLAFFFIAAQIATKGLQEATGSRQVLHKKLKVDDCSIPHAF